MIRFTWWIIRQLILKSLRRIKNVWIQKLIDNSLDEIMENNQWLDR